jgi:hypothetical protein
LQASSRCGRPAHCDYEYERNGTANLFMMFAPLEGWRSTTGLADGLGLQQQLQTQAEERQTCTIEQEQRMRDNGEVNAQAPPDRQHAAGGGPPPPRPFMPTISER